MRPSDIGRGPFGTGFTQTGPRRRRSEIAAPDRCVEEALRQVRRSYGTGFPVWAVGSRVKGGHRPGSDLDILVGLDHATLETDGFSFECGDLTIDVYIDGEGPLIGEPRVLLVPGPTGAWDR